MASARKFYLRKAHTTNQGHVSDCWSFAEPPRVDEVTDDGANSVYRVRGCLRLWKDEAARDANLGHGDEVQFDISLTRANPPKQRHILDALVGSTLSSWAGPVDFTGATVV